MKRYREHSEPAADRADRHRAAAILAELLNTAPAQRMDTLALVCRIFCEGRLEHVEQQEKR